MGFGGGSDSKQSAYNAGDSGLIPGERNGNPLQYSRLENSVDREPGGLQSVGVSEADTTEGLTQTL